MLTVKEVAQRLNASVPAVTLWCRQGRFPAAIKLPGRTTPWLIPESDLVGFVRPDMGRPVIPHPSDRRVL